MLINYSDWLRNNWQPSELWNHIQICDRSRRYCLTTCDIPQNIGEKPQSRSISLLNTDHEYWLGEFIPNWRYPSVFTIDSYYKNRATSSTKKFWKPNLNHVAINLTKHRVFERWQRIYQMFLSQSESNILHESVM